MTALDAENEGCPMLSILLDLGLTSRCFPNVPRTDVVVGSQLGCGEEIENSRLHIRE